MSEAKDAPAPGAPKETFQFRSEARQLLDLVVNSLYSHKEIFLRELVSNAVDALDKLRFEMLTEPRLKVDDGPLEIRVHPDPETRILSVEDNGLGMGRAEMIENLGTIAQSGTRAFVEKLKAAGDKDTAAQLIGQFGVGFYSAFMVAEEVTVVSRKAGEAGATLWRSEGDGTFTVEAAERDSQGTTVTLRLRPVDEEAGLRDFCDEWVLREIVRRYSDFVTYPIRLHTVRFEPTPTPEPEPEPEPSSDSEAAADPSRTNTRKVEWVVVNSQKAIWSRDPAEVSDEEYAELYRHISRDLGTPIERIRIHAEAPFEYTALLFIPEKRPFDLFFRESQHGLQLYAQRVMVMERCEELLPHYLRFVRGVVESPDLSLNISREILQHDRRLAQIRKRVVRKVLDTLTTMKEESFEAYRAFWKEFGEVLKEGVSAEREHADALRKLLLFGSSDDPEAPTTLDGYVERMKEEQQAIYFITGASRSAVEGSPHVEAFVARGYEVLFLVDPVDELLVAHLGEYEGKPLKSVGKGVAELGSEEERQKAEEARKEAEAEHSRLLGAIREALDDHVKEVRFTDRLTTSPACLVVEENEFSPQLVRMLKAAGHEAPSSKRILELNPKHPLVERMEAVLGEEGGEQRVAEHARILHGQALLAEGSPLPDPADFVRLVGDLLVRSA